MSKNFIHKENFVPPSLDHETGEIERIANLFAKENPQEFAKRFMEAAKAATLSVLSDDDWSRLENTDSWEINRGDWDTVSEHASQGSRDWRTLKEKMEKGQALDAPIILKIGDVLHLTTGNTRLMVSRALGIDPHVCIVDMTSFKN